MEANGQAQQFVEDAIEYYNNARAARKADEDRWDIFRMQMRHKYSLTFRSSNILLNQIFPVVNVHNGDLEAILLDEKYPVFSSVLAEKMSEVKTV